jgi:hypothetical protein
MATKQSVARKAKQVAPSHEIAETRQQKFRRLGEARITRAINAVRLVGNLASPNYEYTEQDAMRILGVLEEALDNVRSKFLRKKGKHTLAFSWEDNMEVAHH